MLVLLKENYNVLQFELNSDFEIAFLLVWNFNDDLSIGVRECRITIEGVEIFEGIINQGNGLDCNFNYYTVIPVLPNFKVDLDKLNLFLLKKYAPERKSTPVIKLNPEPSKKKVQKAQKKITQPKTKTLFVHEKNLIPKT